MIYRQVQGLPIGGPLSDLGAALLLGMQEAAWLHCQPLREAERFGMMPDAGGCAAWFAAARYVDDMVVVSRRLCTQCLFALVVAAHPGIPFSCEYGSTAGAMRWLDMDVHCRRFPPHLAMARPELPWALGEAEHPQKYRLRPLLAGTHCRRDELRAHVRSLLAR